MLRSYAQRIILFIGSMAIISSTAHAWNKATHMVIGAMAYHDLQTKAPQTLAKAVSILKQHPYFQRQWANQIEQLHLIGQDQEEFLFMLAARWPDDIRGIDAYHDHASWHFINYIYAPQLGIARSDSTLPTGETILQAYDLNRQLLLSGAPDSIKAIALCWLFHLAGDVHMPLHTTALVDNQFPQGDRGGNLFKIKLMLNSRTTNLHSFWDGMLLAADDFRSVDSLANREQTVYPRTQLPQLAMNKITIVDWSEESFQLAQDNAYRSNTLQAGKDEEGAVLPVDYVGTVKPIAQRQVALSGYRLTDELITDLTN